MVDLETVPGTPMGGMSRSGSAAGRQRGLGGSGSGTSRERERVVKSRDPVSNSISQNSWRE